MKADLITPEWVSLIDRRAAQYTEEIRAMVEHARRCLGQRHRRNQELLGITRARVTGNKGTPQ